MTLVKRNKSATSTNCLVSASALLTRSEEVLATVHSELDIEIEHTSHTYSKFLDVMRPYHIGVLRSTDD